LDVISLCILTPYGYGDQYQAKLLFDKGHLLNTTTKIKIGCVLPPMLFCFCGDEGYDPIYKLYFLLQGKLFSKLQQPQWKDEQEIQEMEASLDEYLALHEGLFPLSQGDLVYHQVSHLMNCIREYGSLRCSGAQAGERANGTLKRLYTKDNKGGVNKHYALVERLDYYENKEQKLVFEHENIMPYSKEIPKKNTGTYLDAKCSLVLKVSCYTNHVIFNINRVKFNTKHVYININFVVTFIIRQTKLINPIIRLN
jgi:hypothetical protein